MRNKRRRERIRGIGRENEGNKNQRKREGGGWEEEEEKESKNARMKEWKREEEVCGKNIVKQMNRFVSDRRVRICMCAVLFVYITRLSN